MKLFRLMFVLVLALTVFTAVAPQEVAAQQSVQCPPWVTDPATECMMPTTWGNGGYLVEVWQETLDFYGASEWIRIGYWWVEFVVPTWVEWLAGVLGVQVAFLRAFFLWWPK